MDHGEGLGGQALLLGEESLAALHQDLLARPELPRFPVALRGQEEVVRGEGHLEALPGAEANHGLDAGEEGPDRFPYRGAVAG